MLDGGRWSGFNGRDGAGIEIGIRTGFSGRRGIWIGVTSRSDVYDWMKRVLFFGANVRLRGREFERKIDVDWNWIGKAVCETAGATQDTSSALTYWTRSFID
jgi:hypothetical protein